ncbi:MAG TPA: DoxX family protein [Candidatus Eisenbacteria bacterium]|nr:DoxX family protein [Candidatus Eisenbacteria bacterium]
MKNSPALLVRLAAASAFLVSGWLKLMQPHENFLAVIQSFEIVHGPVADLASRTLPWAEFTLGMMLFLGLWSRAAAAVLLGFSTLFLGALLSAVLRHLPIDRCGCFGEEVSLPLKQMIAVDCGLWLALAYLALKPAPFSLDRFLEKT